MFAGKVRDFSPQSIAEPSSCVIPRFICHPDAGRISSEWSREHENEEENQRFTGDNLNIGKTNLIFYRIKIPLVGLGGRTETETEIKIEIKIKIQNSKFIIQNSSFYSLTPNL